MKKYIDPDHKEFEFDSKEELEFFYWLKELKEAGLIKNIDYHPEPFILCESFKKDYSGEYKIKSKTFIQKKTYTADFRVIVTDQFRKLFDPFFIIDLTYNLWVDVKGAQTNGKFVNASAYTFPIKQAWTYAKYGVYVNKVVNRPQKSKGIIKSRNLFLNTFVPKKVAYLQSRKEQTLSKDFEGTDFKFLDDILKKAIV